MIRFFFAVGSLLIVLSTALRPAAKYLDAPYLWFPYSIIMVIVLTWISISSANVFRRLVSANWFILGLTSLALLVSAWFYPLADGLKAIGQGQDQDDCTILGVSAILSFEHPFATPTYFGNPCSNLLGALLPHIPFVLVGNMGLAGPTFMIATLFLLLRTGVDKWVLGLFSAAVIFVPATMELMVNGSDLVFIGFAVLTIARILELQARGLALEPSWVWCLAILTAVAGTTRINMILLIVVVGVVLISQKQSLIPLLSTSTLFLLPNVVIYLLSPDNFAPLHLVAKGQSLVPGASYGAMLVATASLLLLGLVFANHVRSAPAAFTAAAFGIHLAFLSYGDLVFNRVFDLFWWEGANYLYLVTPLVIFQFILFVTNSIRLPLKRSTN